MKWFPVVPAIAVVLLTGCGTKVEKLDNDPTVLGITPSLRAQMREVIARVDPQAKPDEVVTRYMDRLRKVATGLKIQPNATGDYVLPPEMDKYSKGLQMEGGVLDGLEVLQDFDLSPPGWTIPLVEEYRSGSISAENKELLIAVMNAELAGLMFQLSQ